MALHPLLRTKHQIKRFKLFPDSVLGGLFLIGLLTVAYGLLVSTTKLQWGLLISSVALGFSIIIAAVYLLNIQIRINAVIFFFSLYISLLLLTLFLRYYDFSPTEPYTSTMGNHSQDFKKAAAEAGVQIDDRSIRQVIIDLEIAGFQSEADPNTTRSSTYPAGMAITYAAMKRTNLTHPDDNSLLPLAEIANSQLALCNEAGPWVTFESDRHGFNNSDDIYNQNNIDFLLIGDSFTQGVCVNRDNNIAGNLINKGYNTVNLGIVGTGPLSQLGILKEYGPLFAPKTVVWLYYQNDLRDLSSELDYTTLTKYLVPEYSQDLANRQAEINALLKDVWLIQNGIEPPLIYDTPTFAKADGISDVNPITNTYKDINSAKAGGTSDANPITEAYKGIPKDIKSSTQAATNPLLLDVQLIQNGIEPPVRSDTPRSAKADGTSDVNPITNAYKGFPKDINSSPEAGTDTFSLDVQLIQNGIEPPVRSDTSKTDKADEVVRFRDLNIVRTTKGILTLYDLREFIGATSSKRSPSISLELNPLFQELTQVLALAKIHSNLIGADFYFVYLPSYSEIANEESAYRDTVKEIIQNSDINYMDFYEYVQDQKDPLNLFPMRMPGHYNAKGYFELSELIVKLTR